MAKNKTVIKLRKVWKIFGKGDSAYEALRDFSLEVRQGEFVMIMGPSGCGKTTLLNLIGLLDKPTEGDYLLNGEDVKNLKDGKKSKIRAKEIGFIFQSYNLVPTLNIVENVTLPLTYLDYPRHRQLKIASDMLENFRLQGRELAMPDQLSGGQQQRVAIARSLIAEPSIILADEPTGNLDSRAAHLVMEELREIHEQGNTIIMVTHNPALLGYGTRVINMLDGEIDTDIKTVEDKKLPTAKSAEKVKVQIKKRGKK